ncbi:MAG: glycosyltransferase [Chitinophagia bacterium]|nr:glycosyltransferase [Chitinophagia bacterium]
MKKLLAERLKRHTYNGVHVQHLRMSPYMLPYSNIPAILDLPDAFSLYWERRKTVKRGLLTQIFENEEQKRVLAYEGILKKYALALACSQEDIDYLQAKHHANNLLLLPNGVDTNTFAPANHSYAHNNTLLFTGNMDYAPNVDAVVYFVQQILPFIQAQYPDVTFIIAGQKPVKKVLELANDKVKVTGFVKNLAEVYNSASVVVAPLRFGAGTQNKVLEAMAMGIPVVCSHIGFKGLGVASGEGVIMQQQPEAFAQAVCQLLHSAAYREEVGKKGIAIIQSRFNWNAIATLLEGYFRRIG